MTEFKVLIFDGDKPVDDGPVPGPKLKAFLDALPRAGDDEFVNGIGVGTFRAKHVRRGLERNVLVVHWSGLGLCIRQPSTHGACQHCASRKNASCEHCACAMCTWFHIADERTSPPVSREKMQLLSRRLKAFSMGPTPAPVVPSLVDDEP